MGKEHELKTVHLWRKKVENMWKWFCMHWGIIKGEASFGEFESGVSYMSDNAGELQCAYYFWHRSQSILKCSEGVREAFNPD